jgi:hypothetical protein
MGSIFTLKFIPLLLSVGLQVDLKVKVGSTNSPPKIEATVKTVLSRKFRDPGGI